MKLLRLLVKALNVMSTVDMDKPAAPGRRRGVGSKVCENCQERRSRYCKECVDGMMVPLRLAIAQAAMQDEGKEIPWTPFERADVNRNDPAAAFAFEGMEVWVNSRYQVAVRRQPGGPWGPMVHLSIKRWDRKPVTDWRDKQATTIRSNN